MLLWSGREGTVGKSCLSLGATAGFNKKQWFRNKWRESCFYTPEQGSELIQQMLHTFIAHVLHVRNTEHAQWHLK